MTKDDLERLNLGGVVESATGHERFVIARAIFPRRLRCRG